MPRTQKRGGDVTGREATRLAEENREALAARANELSMFQQAQVAQSEETVDLTAEPVAEPPVVRSVNEPQPAQVQTIDAGNGLEIVPEERVVVQDVELAPKIVEFRVNEDLENVTIGQGNNYNFVEGTKYRAPKHIYDHLEEKGYVWH